MKTRKTQYILLLVLLLLCGCAKEADTPPQTAAPTTVQTLPTAETMDTAAELAAVTEPPEPPTAKQFSKEQFEITVTEPADQSLWILWKTLPAWAPPLTSLPLPLPAARSS